MANTWQDALTEKQQAGQKVLTVMSEDATAMIGQMSNGMYCLFHRHYFPRHPLYVPNEIGVIRVLEEFDIPVEGWH